MNDCVGFQMLIPGPHDGLLLSETGEHPAEAPAAGLARPVKFNDGIWPRGAGAASRRSAGATPLNTSCRSGKLLRADGPRPARARACPGRPRPPRGRPPGRPGPLAPTPPRWLGPAPHTRRRGKPGPSPGRQPASAVSLARGRRPGPGPVRHSPQQASRKLPTPPRAAPPPCWGWVRRPAYGPRQGSNIAAAARATRAGELPESSWPRPPGRARACPGRQGARWDSACTQAAPARPGGAAAGGGEKAGRPPLPPPAQAWGNLCWKETKLLAFGGNKSFLNKHLVLYCTLSFLREALLLLRLVTTVPVQGTEVVLWGVVGAALKDKGGMPGWRGNTPKYPEQLRRGCTEESGPQCVRRGEKRGERCWHCALLGPGLGCAALLQRPGVQSNIFL